MEVVLDGISPSVVLRRSLGLLNVIYHIFFAVPNTEFTGCSVLTNTLIVVFLLCKY